MTSSQRGDAERYCSSLMDSLENGTRQQVVLLAEIEKATRGGRWALLGVQLKCDCREFKPALRLCASGTLAGADRLDPGCSPEALEGSRSGNGFPGRAVRSTGGAPSHVRHLL